VRRRRLRANHLGGGDPVQDGHRDVHQHDVGLLLAHEVDSRLPVSSSTDDRDAAVGRQNRLERLREEALIVGDHDPDTTVGHLASKVLRVDEQAAREKIHDLLLTGDNRLKQGVSAEKIRQSYEQALAVAKENGLEESVGPLIEIRLADLERLAGVSPPPAPPET